MRPRGRVPWTAVPILVLVVVLASPPALAGLTEAEFRAAKNDAERFMKQSGDALKMERLVATLRDDDSRRAMLLLVRWAVSSARLRTDKLEPEAQERRVALDEYVAKIKKRNKGRDTGWSESQRKKADKLRAASSEAAALVATEIDLGRSLGNAIARATTDDAISWLATDGAAALAAADGAERVLEGAIRLLMTRAPALAGDAVLRAIARPLSPPARIHALDWIALELIDDAALRLGPCLNARSVPVRRAAVRAVRALDDPRSVPLLIDGLGSATGLLASELEQVLHWFTGQSFDRDGTSWKRWWDDGGEAWLAAAGSERHGPGGTSSDVTFYGISSPSDRIAFVLDRSGSMEEPALHGASGPATGEDDAASAAGKTRLAVAKTELRHAINRLGSGVKFNVIFYNHQVNVWRLPPELVTATRENKQKARTWFMSQKPSGSTELFAGLAEALGYADDFSGEKQYTDPGVDTIFLLSDGAPTTEKDGPVRLLTADEIDTAVTAFLKANERHRCVVHTVGVGPSHNESLMRRLAAETGGTYVAVGME